MTDLERVRKALENLLPFVEFTHDRGPEGEGWQSAELMAAIEEANAALAETESA